MSVAVPPPPKGPLKRFRQLWRTDRAQAFLRTYIAHGRVDDDGTVVDFPEPVPASDLMFVSQAGEHHYELYGVDLEATSRSWESAPHDQTVRVPKDDGKWAWEHVEATPEPEPAQNAPVVEPQPVVDGVPARFAGEAKPPRDPQYIPWEETKEGRRHARREAASDPAPGTLMDGVPSGERRAFTRWLNG
jgi:hypothetical protein